MRIFLRAIAILIGICGLVAIVFGIGANLLPSSPVQTEVIEVPNETHPSDGGLVSQEVLKAAGDRIAAGARDFGSDCKAAEDHYMARRGDARCKEAGGLALTYSDTPLPQDPAAQSAESPTPAAP